MIQVVAVPHLPPFRCAMCSCTEGTREFWVDIGVQAEIEGHPEGDGAMFICDVCLTDIVNAVPIFYTKQEMDSLVEILHQREAAAQAATRIWDVKVQFFKSMGIDLEQVWEREISGRNQPDPDPVAVSTSSVGTAESDNPDVSQSEEPANLLGSNIFGE